MTIPTKKHVHLWNDLPDDERHRLMPYMIETQLLHIWQVKQKAIAAHKQHMSDLDDWMKNLKQELRKI